MSDDVDHMEEREAIIAEARRRQIQSKAAMAPGEPGDCDLCGEPSGRLVNGNCAPCRDKYKLA
jgi:hypothetical protein